MSHYNYLQSGRQRHPKNTCLWSNHLNGCFEIFCSLGTSHRRGKTIPLWDSRGISEFLRAYLYAGYLRCFEFFGALVCRTNGAGVRYVSIHISKDSETLWLLWMKAKADFSQLATSGGKYKSSNIFPTLLAFCHLPAGPTGRRSLHLHDDAK